MNRCRYFLWLWMCVVMMVVGTGCLSLEQNKEPTTRPAGTLDDSDELVQLQNSAIIEGTVGSLVYVQGSRLMRVRGYGLVTRLEGRGSRNCPPSIRDRLIKEIRRQRSADPLKRTDLPPTEKVLDSLDTAVVVVEGEIPAAAAKQRTFDLFVSAIDPNTKSIEGGYLLPCELHRFREGGPAKVIEGKTCAIAQGPIFINPFAGAAGSGTTVNLREGHVIGGGCSTLDRPLMLISTLESYATVRRIKDEINQRFPGDKPVADAISPTNVDLKVPPNYRGNEGRFLELVLHLPLATSPTQREARAKMLVSQLTRPEAPLSEIGLSLEGIGISVIPMLQPLYTHPRRPVSFYAARTGLRLGDKLAIEVIIQNALESRSVFRRQAIREMGACEMRHRAGAVLRDLLSDDDPQIVILAYEALRQIDPSCIAQVVVGKDPENFLLELVPSDGDPLIYARRSGIRRIALIGGDRMVCRPPLFYSESGKPVTISADAGDKELTILRKNRNDKTILGPIPGPMIVPKLIRFLGQNLRRDFNRRIGGLDLDYAAVLDVLYRLGQAKAINAQVRWEEPSVEDVFGPLTPMGRPESSL